uniref:RNA-directed DNA polymerase n=1 Tax=Monodelphis domestica TaxID=13616 RepID=A0A5F8HE21_MONDO
MLTDLRQVNESMEEMGALQPGLPVLSWIPIHWKIWAIDLKDCFYTIPLQEKDCKRFAFSVHCQQYVDQALRSIRSKHPKVMMIHYMDDILLAATTVEQLEALFPMLLQHLSEFNLVIAEEKIQKGEEISYLGSLIGPCEIKPQKIQIRMDKLQTLNDFQKMLGDINWIRPFLKLTTEQLHPLFQLLEGDANLKSPRTLTPEAISALKNVEEALNTALLTRFDPHQPVEVKILQTPHVPTAAVVQRDKVILWIHSKSQSGKAIPLYPLLMGQIIKRAIKVVIQGIGQYPEVIHIPVTKAQLQDWIESYTEWASLLQFPCFFRSQTNLSPFWKIFNQYCIVSNPISNHLVDGPNIFVDANPQAAAIFSPPNQHMIFHTPFSRTQQNELPAALLALWKHPESFNLIVDSQYVAQALPKLTNAVIQSKQGTVNLIFSKLQYVLRNRLCSVYVLHVRSHTSLPGPIILGNHIVDQALEAPLLSFSSPAAEAQKAHDKFHQSARALQKQFQIIKAQARLIVKACPKCVPFQPASNKEGAQNPQGVHPLHIW